MEIVKLTDVERSDLDRLEKEIEDNLVSWMKVGFALKEIRDRKLYRTTHSTFEQYTKDRFDCARSTAYQYLSGIQVIENVRNADKNYGILPEKEALVRPLTKLEGDEQPRAWRMAIDRARDNGAETVMVRHVVWAVEALRGQPIEKTKDRIKTNTGDLPEEFREAFRTITESIYTARRNRFHGIDRKKMIEILDGLKRLIEG